MRIVCVPDAPAASRPTASRWPVPQASHPAFDVQACVAVCSESMATHARMRDASSARGVRDASSAHACRAVEWERGRGRGEAEADRNSRCAHLFEVHKILCTPKSPCLVNMEYSEKSLFGNISVTTPNLLARRLRQLLRSSLLFYSRPPLPRVCVVACVRRKPHH